MEVATRLARDYWHDKFHATEAEAEAERRPHTA
jgi:hypothetical protein